MEESEGRDRDRRAAKALSKFLLYGFIPMWTAAGVLDWMCHKRTDIEHTSGTKEALLHILMNAEAGLPLTLGLLCEINAGVLLAMFAGFALHEATVWWDIDYAEHHREAKPYEQHVHSFLEVMPLMGLSMAACLHPEQFSKKADFALRLKREFEPPAYWLAVVAMVAGGVVLPYANELWRCLRAQNEPHYNTGFYKDGELRMPPEPEPAPSRD